MVVTAFFLIVVLALWISLSIHSKLKSFGLSKIDQTVYDGVLFDKPISLQLSDSGKLISPRDMQMQDEEIWSHSHRMYLLGDNSIAYPWFISKDFPPHALESTY